MEHTDVGSDDVDDDKRNVILLVQGCSLPLPELGEYLQRQLGGWLRPILAYDPLQLAVTKCFARGIFGLGHTIGVQQEAVEWFHWHAAHRVLSIRIDSEQQAVTFDTLHFATRMPP